MARPIKLMERLNLRVEADIASILQTHGPTQKIIGDPARKILIVGDPDLAMASMLPVCKKTIVEADPGQFARTKVKALGNSNIQVVHLVYPAPDCPDTFDLIVLKHILHFNWHQDMLGGALKDLSPHGVICVSEPGVFNYCQKAHQLLEQHQLQVTQYPIPKILGGTVFLASRQN